MASHHEHHKHKGRFHDYTQALEYDQMAAKSDIRAQLALKLIAALELKGGESVLDLATGTGRIARPAAALLKGGRIIGLDEALAMLRVAKEQKEKEPIPGFVPVAGNAEAFPFRANALDRIFTAFAFHHFGRPALIVREAHRVLKRGGRLAVLDPVVPAPENSLDEAIHKRVNEILHSTHGEPFHYYSLRNIEDLMREAGLGIVRADLHSFAVDQEGMEGIPTGRHWLEVAVQMEHDPPEIRRRFEEKYFRYEKAGEKLRVKGSFGFAIVCGEKS